MGMSWGWALPVRRALLKYMCVCVCVCMRDRERKDERCTSRRVLLCMVMIEEAMA